MSGSISIPNIPPSLNPGTSLSVQPGSNTTVQNLQTLILGQMLPSGTGVPNESVFVSGVNDVVAAAGAGSMAHAMAIKIFATNPLATTYLTPLVDAPTAVKASGTVTITGTATSTGTVVLSVAENLFSVGVSVGDTALVIIAKLLATILTQVCFVTAAAVTNVITLTANNAGLVGNDMVIALNPGGSVAGQVLPTGITVEIVGMSGGVVNPDITQALANLQDEPFDFIANAYGADLTATALIKEFLGATSGRWAPNRVICGRSYGAMPGTPSDILALVAEINDPHQTVIGYESERPTWSPMVAGELTAEAALSLSSDPSLPLQNIALNLPSTSIASRFNYAIRNTLLNGGVTTMKAAPDGSPILERTMTTYLTNAAGLPDNSWQNVETDQTLSVVIRDLKTDSETTFARKKFAPAGSRITPTPANNIVTTTTIKAHFVARYRYLETLGYVVNSDEFATGIVVQQQGTGIAAVYMPIQLMGQLRQINILVSFSTPT